MMDVWDKGFAYILADILSSITILICLCTKIPQIRTIAKQKTSHGISLTSLNLEIVRYSIMWCYNYCFGYPILMYLEYPSLLVQQCILVYLVLRYSNQVNMLTIVTAMILLTTIGLFFIGILPRNLLSALIPLCTPIGGFSKMIQFMKIVRTKDSTNVSLTTWFLTSFTSLSRIYTVYFDSGDKMLLANSTTSFVTSVSVYLAAFYYKKLHTQ